MIDVAIVGGGVAGGALATVLARAGMEVAVVERSLVHEDRVRGEWLAPWGVAEVRTLGLYDDLIGAGAHQLRRHITYDAALAPADAELFTLPLESFVDSVAGPLTIGHPALCDLYERTAREAGAIVHRGAGRVELETGERPRVRFVADDGAHELEARLVIGADGRDSTVRRQLGIDVWTDRPHHLFAGLLIEGATGWPEDLQVVATEKDTSFLAFPQGGGRIRLYAAHALTDSRRFAGADAAANFLTACVMDCCPPSVHLAGARVAGPCRTFRNSDAAAERIAAPGVVLIGDAAGHNDPLIGQGLSITHRDVRLLRDALLGEREWSARTFTAYAEERRERMRRLRIAAAFQALIEAEFDEAAHARRGSFLAGLADDPDRALSLVVALAGPDAAPAERYDCWLDELGAEPSPPWPVAPI